MLFIADQVTLAHPFYGFHIHIARRPQQQQHTGIAFNDFDFKLKKLSQNYWNHILPNFPFHNLPILNKSLFDAFFVKLDSPGFVNIEV